MRYKKVFIYIKLFFFLFWCVFFIISFSYENLNKNNIKEWNVLFVLDISNSMNVDDVFYNSQQVSRLKMAKKIIENNVKNIDKKFWLILFSDKIDYFIVSTKDKQTYTTYLKTVNTNHLNGWNMKFVDSLNSLNNVLNINDSVILISDFDTKEDLSKVKLNNYVHSIGIWKSWKSIVKNKNWEKIYIDNKLLKSSFGKQKFKKFNSNSKQKITEYAKGEKLSFLSRFNDKNTVKKSGDINYIEILSFIFIIFWL